MTELNVNYSDFDDFDEEDENMEKNMNQEPEVNMSTKDAILVIGRNTKAGAKKAWNKAKPVLKKLAIGASIVGAGAYLVTTLTNTAGALTKNEDEDWSDDIIDGTGEVIEPEFVPQETEEPVVDEESTTEE